MGIRKRKERGKEGLPSFDALKRNGVSKNWDLFQISFCVCGEKSVGFDLHVLPSLQGQKTTDSVQEKVTVWCLHFPKMDGTGVVRRGKKLKNSARMGHEWNGRTLIQLIRPFLFLVLFVSYIRPSLLYSILSLVPNAHQARALFRGENIPRARRKRERFGPPGGDMRAPTGSADLQTTQSFACASFFPDETSHPVGFVRWVRYHAMKRSALLCFRHSVCFRFYILPHLKAVSHQEPRRSEQVAKCRQQQLRPARRWEARRARGSEGGRCLGGTNQIYISRSRSPPGSLENERKGNATQATNLHSFCHALQGQSWCARASCIPKVTTSF